jgi:hypothetical protein
MKVLPVRKQKINNSRSTIMRGTGILYLASLWGKVIIPKIFGVATNML